MPGDADLSKERDVEMADPEQRGQRFCGDGVKEMGNSDRISYPPSPILRPTGPDAINDPPFSLSSNKYSISYAEYTFVKNPAHMGQKTTWAIVDKEKMPASQADLKRQVDKNLKKGITGLDQYLDSEMTGSKRKQIDDLIRECIRMNPDPRFEIVIASIKSGLRRRKCGHLKSIMEVILKRQPRTGIDMHDPFTEFSSIRLPSNGLIDNPYHYNRTADPYSLSSESNHVRH